MNTVKVKREDRINGLLAALKDGALAVEFIAEIERIGPVATEAVPALTKLKMAPSDAVRAAAVQALKKIEAAGK